MPILDRIVRGVQVIFLLVGIGLLSFGLFGMADTYWKVAEARRWPAVPGVALNRDWRGERWVGRSGSGTRFVPEIRYRYAVGGRTYVSEHVYPAAAKQRSSQEELQSFMNAEFPAPGPVTVSYDPAEPERSAIILRGSYGAAITLALCGLVMLAGSWAVPRASRSPAGE